MAKKTLLTGRKRTSELTSNHAVEAKKEELLNLKSEAHPQEVLSTMPQPAVQEAPVVMPAPAQMSGPVASKLKIGKSVVDEGVTAFVTQLHKLYSQLDRAGNSQRHQYTLQARHEALIQEIKRAVRQLAEQQQSQGLNDATNMARCQEFVDAVRKQLKTMGIQLSSLQVHPLRPQRFVRR